MMVMDGNTIIKKPGHGDILPMRILEMSGDR
jgi:hypothetical protein